MKRLINTITTVLKETDSINTAIGKMMTSDSNTAVVVNHNQIISGIVTEKDIFRRILEQGASPNLQEKVKLIMTTPVEMAFLGNLESDVMHLHDSMGYLHYPVTRKNGSLDSKYFVGIISVTEIARHLISNLNQSLQ